MPSTRSRGEPILSLDPELNNIIRRMNIQNNRTYIDGEINPQLPPLIDAHNQVIIDIPGKGNPRRQPPTLRPQE